MEPTTKNVTDSGNATAVNADSSLSAVVDVTGKASCDTAPIPAVKAAPRMHAKGTHKRLAIVTMGVKLADESRGYTRFRYLAKLLVEQGFTVDLITSSFQHWEKAQRDTSKPCYSQLPYKVVFIDEPGYKRNLDMQRIRSHKIAANNMRNYFKQHEGEYALVYSEIPPNDVALACAESAKAQHIPFIADINDLWPEAMRMAVDIPIVSSIAFHPFARDARKVYNLMDGAVGTSDEYARQPMKYRSSNYPHITVYVGNDLAEFDEGAARFAADIEKPEGQIWLTYAGTLGASYDISTLITAAAVAGRKHPKLRVKILGDGPDRQKLEELAAGLDAPVDFMGYQDYAHMAAYLVKSDITINSLVRSAPQSIVTKIGDYLASGHPMINTGSSPEMRKLVETEGFGMNVEAENVNDLVDAMGQLAEHSSMRKIMGVKGRSLAESKFDQPHSYAEIANFIRLYL